MTKTFENVQVGDVLFAEHYVFPFTESAELIVKSKTYNNGLIRLDCETKGGSKHWFEVSENATEFYNEQSVYENTKVTII